MKIAYAAYYHKPANKMYHNKLCDECRRMLVDKHHNVFNYAHLRRYHDHLAYSMKIDKVFYFEECDED